MDRGAVVLGAASMGALRAAELRRDGMIGLGTVYQLFASGELDADDEVAVAHSEAAKHFRALSVALVSVRIACREMLAAGEISTRTSDRLIAAVKEIYFTERSLPGIRMAARDAGCTEDEVSLLTGRLHGGRDVKWRDAELALRQARYVGERPRVSAPIGHTHHVARWQDRYEAARRTGEPVPRSLVLGVLQCAWPGFADLYESLVREDLAALWKCRPDDAGLAREFTIRTGLSRVSEERAAQWFEDRPPAADLGVTCDLARLAILSHRHAPGLAPLHLVWEALADTPLMAQAADGGDDVQ
jgi:hypothetical protein